MHCIPKYYSHVFVIFVRCIKEEDPLSCANPDILIKSICPDNSGQWEWSPPTSEKPAPCNPGSYDLVPGECNAFLTCTTNAVAQKSYCKEGLHWNQETLSCGWASDSDCVADADAPNVFYKEGNYTKPNSFP